MKRKSFLKVFLIGILVVGFLGTIYFNSKEIMLPSNIEKGVSKFWGRDVSVKKIEDFEAYGKKFKLVLSIATDNEKYKYMNCYEEKANGLFYKFYQGAEQGGSNASFSFSTIFVDNGQGLNKENYFTVVYGYNKDFKVVNYEIKLRDGEGSLISDIENEEYFIDITNGKFQAIVNAIDKNGDDRTDAFF